jgi:hypothetical protein
MNKITFYGFIFSAVLLTGAIGSVAVYADDDDHDNDHDDDDDKKHKTKTLEGECAKKKPNNFDGLLCQAVLALQGIFEPFGGPDGFFDLFAALQMDLEDHLAEDHGEIATLYTRSMNDVKGTITVQCDSNDIAVGGGANWENGRIESSFPVNSDGQPIAADEAPTGWQSVGDSNNAVGNGYAVCMDITP